MTVEPTCVSYLLSHGMYFDVEKFTQLSIQVSETVYEPKSPSTVASLGYLAHMYEKQGGYPKAESLYPRALVIHERPDIATALKNLALLHHDEAELLYQRVLAIYKK